MKRFQLALSALAGASTLILFPNISSAAVLAPGSSIGVTGVSSFNPSLNDNPPPESINRVDFLTFTTASNQSGDFVTGTFNQPIQSVSSINLNYLSTSGDTASYDATVATNPFIDFGSFTLGSETNNLSFTAPNSFGFDINNFNSESTIAYTSEPMEGYFTFGEETIAEGSLTLNRSGTTDNYSLTIVVPNPEPDVTTPEPSAMLGLVAILGLGALTKKDNKKA